MFGSRKGPHHELEKRLSHRFKDQALLEQALRHASTRGDGRSGAAKSGAKEKPKDQHKMPTGDNERLEFLGDRVLGLVIAELLTETFPAMSEGELALRFTRLVRGETCSEVARELGLGEHIIFSGSERQAGGRVNETILGDACEALLGAVFVDAGYSKSRKVVRRLWAGRLAHVEVIRSDPKTSVQEWAQGNGRPLPVYRIAARCGPDHAPHFEIELTIKGLDPVVGVGASKRGAEQAAAQILLEREGVWAKSQSTKNQ